MSTGQRETRPLAAIERRSVQILAVLAAASIWFQSWPVSLGVVLGGGVAILNFHWLRRVMAKVILEGHWLHGIQVLIKFIVLVIGVFLLLRHTPVSGAAFAVGTSTLLGGILFEGLWGSLRQDQKGSE